MKVVGWFAFALIVLAGCGRASKVTSDGHVPSDGPPESATQDAAEDSSPDAGGDASDGASDVPPDDARSDGGGTDDASDGGDAHGTPVTYPTFVGGTRLHVNRIVGDDGSSAPIGLYDVEVDAPCSFRLAGDGAMRCLPTGVAGAEVLFTDDKCSKPFAVLPACSPPGDWVYAAVTGSAGVAALKVGADVTVAGAIWRLNAYPDHSECSPAGGPAPDAHLRAVEVVLPERFVKGSMQASSAVAPIRMSATYLVGADGSKALVSYQDSVAGTCTFTLGADGARYCFPGTGGSGVFSNATCSDPIATAPHGESPPAWTIAAPTGLPSVHRVGAPYQGDWFWRAPVGGCTLLNDHAGRDAYTIGTEDVTAQVLVWGKAGPLDAPGRLKRPSFTAADGTVIEQVPGDLLDTRFGERCRYQAATDGLRCLPMRVRSSGGPDLWVGWRDDKCTEPVYRTPLSLDSTFPSAGQVHWSVGGPDLACGDAPVVEVNSGEKATLIFAKIPTGSTETCQPGDSTAPGAFFTLGASVPLTDFVAGTPKHD